MAVRSARARISSSKLERGRNHNQRRSRNNNNDDINGRMSDTRSNSEVSARRKRRRDGGESRLPANEQLLRDAIECKRAEEEKIRRRRGREGKEDGSNDDEDEDDDDDVEAEEEDKAQRDASRIKKGIPEERNERVRVVRRAPSLNNGIAAYSSILFLSHCIAACAYYKNTSRGPVLRRERERTNSARAPSEQSIDIARFGCITRAYAASNVIV